MEAQCLVIGAGPGGYAAAFRASDLGMKVVLVERYAQLGGVCLNVGCIPSKALLHVAELIQAHNDYEKFGLEAQAPTVNIDKLKAFKSKTVAQLTGGLAMLAKKRKITVIQGQAKFTGARSAEVVRDDGTKETITFEKCVLAAGSRPINLGFLPDDPRIIDSTGALTLPVTKGKMLIIGGGIIGCEMASVYQALGMQVTVCEALSQIMPGADRDLVAPCHKRLEQHGVQIHTQTMVKSVKAGKKNLTVHMEMPGGKTQTVDFDLVLQAVGRRSNADKLDCAQAGIELDDKGYVTINAQTLQTSNADVLAIGDIVGGHMLAHKATAQGRVAAEMLAGKRVVFDAKVIPSVAYTDPEVAWVGLTEEEAKRTNQPYEKGMFPWAANGRALCLGRGEGLTKIIMHPETKRVLGAGVCGKNAGELIGELALAIEMGAHIKDIALTVHPHPTLVETVGLAAEVAEGTVTDLYLG